MRVIASFFYFFTSEIVNFSDALFFWKKTFKLGQKGYTAQQGRNHEKKFMFVDVIKLF